MSSTPGAWAEAHPTLLLPRPLCSFSAARHSPALLLEYSAAFSSELSAVTLLTLILSGCLLYLVMSYNAQLNTWDMILPQDGVWQTPAREPTLPAAYVCR